MRFFTPDEDQFLRDNYLTIPAKRMAKMLGRTEGTARQRMKLLGIVVPPEVVQRFKEESYIKKGNVSFNKGKKQTDYCSPEAIAKSAKTRFKKQGLPANTLYDGAIVSRRDKTGRNYKWIRISQAHWKMLHVYNWEQVHGPIPQDMIVVFKDKDCSNCEVSNLEMITRAQNMKRNTLHNYPKEIVTTIQLLGAMKRQINKQTKKIKNEK